MLMRKLVAGIAYLSLTACSPASEHDSHRVKIPAPEPVKPQPPFQRPPGWVRAKFVEGMSVAVPSEATVVYPQGIDSNIMFVAGPGYSLDFHDYGTFTYPATTRVAGRLAHSAGREKGACRARSYEIELPAQVSYLLACDGGGPDRKCTALPARANIGTLCNSATACAAVDTMINSIRFAPKPYSAYPEVDPQWQSPEQPVCNVD